MENYIQKIISVFTASKHSEKVIEEVHQWLVDKEYSDEKEAALHTLWSETEGKADAGTWASLSNVYNKIGAGQQKTVRKFRMQIWQYAAVAVVVLAVAISGTFFYAKNMYSEVAMIEKFTPAGGMITIELPDGSKVQTNSGTLLLYPEAFKGDTRTVYLVGEANFKVKKDPEKPFIVRSGSMAVTALGTEFNVGAYPESNEIVATLLHGKIKVDCDEERRNYILHPGQQIIYQKNSGQVVLANADVEAVTAWQRGLYIFRGDTMKEIIAELERRFNITFQCNISHFSNDKYNFSFRKNSDIGEIMDIMKEVVGGFDYKIEENVCYIKLIK